MNFLHSELLCCPHDLLPLHQNENCLQCEGGHSFDIARRGYVNLLGPGDKRSKDPGDSKEMVVARRAFLDRGHYKPVADRLAALVNSVTGERPVIVDAGCGEGYYLDQLRQQLATSEGLTPSMIGFDISKWAVQAAASRLAATWLVASNRLIPLAPGSVDCLLSVFGFPVFESFKSVLRDEGTLLTVTAGPAHLIELREVLYPSVIRSEPKVTTQALSAGFIAGEASTLTFKTAPLSQLEVNQLLSMTPHLFRASREGRKRSTLLDKAPITVDVIFNLFYSYTRCATDEPHRPR